MKKFLGVFTFILIIGGLGGYYYVQRNLTDFVAYYTGIKAESIKFKSKCIVAKGIRIESLPGLHISEAVLKFNAATIRNLKFQALELKNGCYELDLTNNNETTNIADIIRFIQNPPIQIQEIKTEKLWVYIKPQFIFAQPVRMQISLAGGLAKNELPQIDITVVDQQKKSYGQIKLIYLSKPNPSLMFQLEETVVDFENLPYQDLEVIIPKKLEVHGTFAAQGSIAFIDGEITQDIALKFKNFRITHKGIIVDGLNTTVQLNNLWPIRAKIDPVVTVDIIATPIIVVKNVRGHVTLGDQIILNSATGQAFDGQLSINPVTLHPLPEKQHFTTILRGINLKKVSNMLEVPALKATGFVNGRIPITFHNDQTFSIDNGQLQTISNGKLSYRWDEGLHSHNSNVVLTAKALQGFQYNTLRLVLNKSRHGNLEAILDMHGKNRKLFKERPIHIKINIAGALLETMEMTWEAFRGKLKGLRKKIHEKQNQRISK